MENDRVYSGTENLLYCAFAFGPAHVLQLFKRSSNANLFPFYTLHFVTVEMTMQLPITFWLLFGHRKRIENGVNLLQIHEIHSLSFLRCACTTARPMNTFGNGQMVEIIAVYKQRLEQYPLRNKIDYNLFAYQDDDDNVVAKV